MRDGEKNSYQSFDTSTKQQSSCCCSCCCCNSINRSRWMILSFRIMPKNFVIHQKNRHLLSVRCSAVFVDRAFAFASYHFASVRSISIHSIWLACVCQRMYMLYTLCSFAQNVFMHVYACAIFWVSKSVCRCLFSQSFFLSIFLFPFFCLDCVS